MVLTFPTLGVHGVRSSANESVEELRGRITAMHDKERQLQQRNSELQHLLMDVQAKLDGMKDQTSAAANLVSKRTV